MFLLESNALDGQEKKSQFGAALVQMGVRSVRVSPAREPNPARHPQTGLLETANVEKLEKVLVGQS